VSAERNEAALRRSAEAWNAGDLDAYLEIYAPSLRHHGIDPRHPLDAVENRRSYQRSYAAFAGSTLTVDAIVADGDMLTSRFRLEGVHTGPFMGVPASGHPIRFGGMNMMRFDDGRVVERWTVADTISLLHQIGGTITF
jgi:predicted ester cyclase